MDSNGLNHISLVQVLRDNYIRQRVSKDAKNWKTMADAFDSIAQVVRMAGKTKAYNEPRYEKSTDIHAISNNSNSSQRGSFSRAEALIGVTMTTVGTTARTIHIKLQDRHLTKVDNQTS